MTDKVYIFSNGTQFADWHESNCAGCTKSSLNDATDGTKWPLRCEIEGALAEAYMDDGKVTPDISKRAGVNEETEGRYAWMCSEVEWTELHKINHLTRQLADANERIQQLEDKNRQVQNELAKALDLPF